MSQVLHSLDLLRDEFKFQQRSLFPTTDIFGLEQSYFLVPQGLLVAFLKASSLTKFPQDGICFPEEAYCDRE